MNPGQARAIKRRYQPLVKRGVAPAVLWSSVPRTFADDARRAAICAELKASGAELLVLLGDRPVQEFLSAYHQAKDLRTLTDGGRTYGRSFEVSIDGYSTSVLPLVHPRQAARLGRSSTEWGKHHANWVRRSLTSR
jgi:uracil-DNA glycosylase